MEKITRPKRNFLSEDFKVTDWEGLKGYFDQLANRPIPSVESLETWFRDRSELESVISEDMAWRYVRMTCYTENEAYREQYQYFVEQIQPHIAPYSDSLNKKAMASPHIHGLAQREGFDIMVRNIKKEIEIFREENIPLFTEITTKTQQYAQLSGAMMVEVDGKEQTLQQASVQLMSTDRNRRQTVYEKVSARRLEDKERLDSLFTELAGLRHKVALNAGFKNFRDYMFVSLGRFDYSPKDCFDFHESIQMEVVPLLDTMAKERKGKLGLTALRPWDKAVDTDGREPLKPFDGGKELMDKTIEVFHRLDPFLGECLGVMKDMGHLDLESRKGKAPGGYNYPLSEIGVPFIFMNATSTLRDLVTLLHEGGHAVHNFLTRDLLLNEFKSPPSEVAELASMSMELISMDHWDVFFADPLEKKRAMREHLEDIVETLPWVATIDAYQHWVYEHPGHGVGDRKKEWNQAFDRFTDRQTDWKGLEEAKDYLWQKQLHLFEVPFYYIEYGMAQLGAIAVWRNFRQNRAKGLEGYQRALALGNLRSIPEIYKAAGIRFDFSRPYIRELMQFLGEELSKTE